ncbi:MAG TPA: PVC-type heme-binding CxxCH protein, partial [Pirellulales bacterium]|nr:PVC-type heme-binding CxxCH protein [Pirellulales bacterium]
MILRRFLFLPLLWAVLAIATLAAADEAVPSTAAIAAVPAELKVADGFEVERVAGSPLVERPITMALDELGRLYVADSSGSNDPVEKQLAERPHRVLRLEDTDGDGRYDRRTVFADQLMFPEGTMWLAGSLYVAAPPSIWKLTDTDDDGVADKREEWFAGKTLTGCANDLHGPYAGRDGWIYWCKGAFAEQTYDLPGRPAWKTRASHIFRARRDGSGLEPVMTGGMDNPVDVVFTPEGERILSCTFLVQPGGGQRDGLIHAIYGGVYGKQHNVLDGHVRTGELMPVLAHLGPAAASGLEYVDAPLVGHELNGKLLVCQFNLHKVTRHRLVRLGASYKTEERDFLASESPDFHPTDVICDADGSVLVCDTGGWYKLCCPTSQFHKPNVLGAIYRVRPREAVAVSDPRGSKILWSKATPAELAEMLGDQRPAVRDRAIEELGLRGKDALAPLAAVIERGDPAGRLSAVWALARIDDPAARQLVTQALTNVDQSVQQAAAHVAGLWRDRDARPALEQLLSSAPEPVKRSAAEALGRIGDVRSVPALLDASGQAGKDRTLEHSLIYALIEIGDRAAIRKGLADPTAFVQRPALLALSQLYPGDLTVYDVMPLFDAKNARLREAAWWVAEQRPEWGEYVAKHLADRLRAARTDAEKDRLLEDMAR